MFNFLSMLGLDKLPLEGARTYIMIVLGVLAAIWPDIKMLIADSTSLSTMEFLWMFGKIIVPAILAAFYKHVGVENARNAS